MSRHPLIPAIALCMLLCLLGADQPAEPPATQPDAAALQRDYEQQTAPLGGHRDFDQGVLAVTLPRTDLWVQSEMGEVPTAAGLASNFYFFRCSCGKDRVVGQFCLVDYEVNDVIDALRAGRIEIVSVSAMFSGDKPRMMQLRFQGEGQTADLVKTLKAAFNWIGQARSARQLPQDELQAP